MTDADFNVAAEWKRHWVLLLKAQLQPSRVTEGMSHAPQFQILQDGMVLKVPGYNSNDCYYLHLDEPLPRPRFSDQDVALVKGLKSQMDQLFQFSTSMQSYYQQERELVVRDLHDDVVPLLLNLVHRQLEPELSQTARFALKRIKETIYSLDGQKRYYLKDLLHDWEGEVRYKLSCAHMSCHWLYEGDLSRVLVSGREQINISRTLDEAINNIIKHSDAKQVDVSVYWIAEATALSAALRESFAPVLKADPSAWPQLLIAISDDGHPPPSSQWSQGTGQLHMRNRISELGGEMAWINQAERETSSEHGFTVALSVPLCKQLKSSISIEEVLTSSR